MDISQVATVLRPASKEVLRGEGKLCLSAYYLNKLNSAFESDIGEDVNLPLHVVETSDSKTKMIKDLQFLLDLVQRTISLKVIPDVNEDFNNVNITRFKNIKTLEIHKLDINLVVGIQKLRSQLQTLSCCHSIRCLSDILDKCGGDNSQRYTWNELKTADFSHNKIQELDGSLECMISLHSLNLSHNQFDKMEFINQLPNLKYLNISYNKLENIPQFKGQICNRLQVLVLNNNFIEDLNGLTSLSSVVQLDLSQNCLLDHKTLLSVSHMACLQWLSLQGNPISFHPHHRNLTCNYLNKNSSTLKFILDNVPLNRTEKSLTGSFYPIFQTSLVCNSSNNSSDDLTDNSIQERTKKIRNVLIEDDNKVKEENVPMISPSVSSQHLEIKKQVEHLRKEYGESWLHRHSGLLVQDLLGFDKTLVLSSTPCESGVDSLYLQCPSDGYATSDSPQFDTANNSTFSATEVNEENFETAHEDSAIFSNTVQVENELSDVSDGEDICSGGEECIYLAINKSEEEQVCVVVTETHISEIDVTTSKEKARWHINTIRKCEKMQNNEHTVKIDFDTLRRNRKQRIYELDPKEAENFYNLIQERIDNIQLPVVKKIMYQCMKCSELFPEMNKNALLDGPSVTCPRCKSNLVVENI